MNTEEALQLAAKIASGQYDPDEMALFIHYIESADAPEVSRILDAYKAGLDREEVFHSQVEPGFMNRLAALKPAAEKEAAVFPIERKPILGWARLGVAIALLTMIVTSYMYYRRQPLPKQAISVAPIAATARTIDAPKMNRATITLSDGRKISLDSLAAGPLANQGNTRVLKLADGQISYQGNTDKPLYNTLTNPRGSRPVSIALSDGSTAWLNAGSALVYPVAFTGKERRVEISGEGYFEVAPNAKMPFVVKPSGSDASIRVLGTHFNVNAYADEGAARVTLLEGSVDVLNAAQSHLLKPGQQARLADGGVKIISDVDMSEVMAWKRGKFYFGEKMDIHTIMRQIARWYDVEVKYEGKDYGHFGGSVSLDADVSQVLRMLESTGGVHFKVEGRQVIVLP